MGSKVLVAAICWLALCEALEVNKKVNSPIVKDNESAESAPRLYSRIKNAVGVYASAAPYGAFSYNAPTVIRAPLTAGSQVAPVSVSGSVPGDNNGYLKNLRDSYGKYLASPQAAGYKAAFSQQYLPIQALPAHLSQPLAAVATPNSQYRPFAPNYFFGTQFKVPSLYSYSATPTPLTYLGSASQPLIYAGNIKNLSPITSFFSRGNGYPGSASAHYQQATGSKSYYADAPYVQQFQQKPQQQSVPSANENAQQIDGHTDQGQIQAAPAQTSVTAIVNGEKTVVTLDTNPPIPQVDLNLLEPLTFANPVVPQVQHFLPKINTAIYEERPIYKIQHSKTKHKDIPVSRTNYYNKEDVQSKPKKIPNKKNEPRTQNVPVKPQVIVKGNPDEEEFSYQINTPNHKETYNEQVVSYNKETNPKPVTYSYNTKKQSEPENYSYSHTSQEPLTVKHVEYVDNERPKHLVYTLSPEEREEENNAEIHSQQPESEDSSTESIDDGDSPVHEEAALRPENKHIQDNDEYSHRHQSYRDDDESPKQFIQIESTVHPSTNYQNLPQYHSSKQSPGYVYHSGHKHLPTSGHHKNYREHHSNSPRHHHHHHHHQSTERTSNPIHNSESPRQSPSLRAEHRGHEYKQQPKEKLQHEHSNRATPQHYSQPLAVPVQNAFQPITEYEEDIRTLPTQTPNAPHGSRNAHIKVDPAQHIQLVHSEPIYETPPQKHFAPIKLQNEQRSSSPPPTPYPRQFSTTAPHILEKSKRVFIQEKEETPNEMHMHLEQEMAKMVEHAENNEKAFEKGYKESAFGFPAYETVAEEAEDEHVDPFNPDSYGAPRYQTPYHANVEDSPFEKYQAEGDQYPKSVRSSYKDARDDKKEDYYLDFAVNKPDVYTDFYKKKADYYKSFKKQRPEDSFFHRGDENYREKKENENERTVVADSSFLYPVSPAEKPKQNKYISAYKAPTLTFKHAYSKGNPRDNRAYASQPYINKYRTNFVEPQFQYGFEPITLPLVLDSELAAMATNDSPESEKPGTRKKVYEENWYIKKTRTAAGKPS